MQMSLTFDVCLKHDSLLFTTDLCFVVQLNNSLPPRTIGHCWVLVYSTFQHGFSLKTLYRKMEYYDTPVLLVVTDDTHQVSAAI